MSGLDKIIKEIHREAESEAKAVEAEAKSYCDDFMEKKKKEIELKIDSLSKESEDSLKAYEEKTVSGCEFRKRNAILSAKSALIDETVAEAKESIYSMSDAEYFDLLTDILKKNINSGAGVMKLSKKDLSRVTSDFEKSVFEIAEEAGGTMEISKEPADISGGFILIYGDIEENCTIDAIFSSGRDAIRDLVGRVLFSDAK